MKQKIIKWFKGYELRFDYNKQEKRYFVGAFLYKDNILIGVITPDKIEELIKRV
jgi:hypothetical protein